MQVLRARPAAKKVGMSVTSMYRFIKDGTFPKPIRLGKQNVGWLESEIDQWIQERLNEREAV